MATLFQSKKYFFFLLINNIFIRCIAGEKIAEILKRRGILNEEFKDFAWNLTLILGYLNKKNVLDFQPNENNIMVFLYFLIEKIFNLV